MPTLRVLFAATVIAGIWAGTALGHRATPRRAKARPRPVVHMVLPGEFEPVERVLVAWDDALAEFLTDVVEAASEEAEVVILHSPDQDREVLDHHLRTLRARRQAAGERASRARESPRVAGAQRGARGARGRRGIAVEPAQAHGKAIRVLRIPVDAIWIRDFGPLVVRGASGGRALVDFEYFDGADNDEVPEQLARRLWPRWSLRRSALELEGGNVLSDGNGRCLTTAGYVGDEDEEWDNGRSLVDADDVKRVLRRELGCRRVFILPPLNGEATGHVDMLATITAPGEVIVGEYDEIDDPINAERLDRAAATLRAGGFKVRRIPMPNHDDERFRSYTNAIAINGVVLVPVYPEDSSGERKALATFRAAYPGRRIVPIVSSDVIQLDGAVHCATMTVARVE